MPSKTRYELARSFFPDLHTLECELDIEALCFFLVKTMAFPRNLCSISLDVDNIQRLTIDREASAQRSVLDVPANLQNTNPLFAFHKVTTQTIEIRVKVRRIRVLC